MAASSRPTSAVESDSARLMVGIRAARLETELPQAAKTTNSAFRQATTPGADVRGRRSETVLADILGSRCERLIEQTRIDSIDSIRLSYQPMTAEASQRRTRPNLADVAALAGVSRSTASLAFSGAGPVSESTRARVVAAAAKLKYGGPDPRAQSLRRGRSGIIGVVMEERIRDAFRDPINIAMLDGLADEIGATGAGLLLLTETGAGQLGIASAPMDAVVLIGCSTRLDESVAVLRQRGMPIVAIEAPPMDGVLAIDLENRAGSETAARQLRDLGHERVAVVALPLEQSHEPGILPANWREVSTSEVARQRLLGVTDVYDDFAGYVASTSSIEAGTQAGLVLLESADERPTAIVAQSDLLAVGVIRAAEQLGLAVSGDLSVVGFDGARIDSGYDLTTMVQPAMQKGRAAGRAVNDMLAGRTPEQVTFTTVWHAGATIAAAKPPLPARRPER
jgi:DNA-binding LacI/PurR family transcriptional regulator